MHTSSPSAPEINFRTSVDGVAARKSRAKGSTALLALGPSAAAANPAVLSPFKAVCRETILFVLIAV
jgi:hypothetical protein